jgi:hypothetical protein
VSFLSVIETLQTSIEDILTENGGIHFAPKYVLHVDAGAASSAYAYLSFEGDQ